MAWRELFTAVGVSAAILPWILPTQLAVPASHTQVVFLGTGHPGADPDRSRPATAVVVNYRMSWPGDLQCELVHHLLPVDAA